MCIILEKTENIRNKTIQNGMFKKLSVFLYVLGHKPAKLYCVVRCAVVWCGMGGVECGVWLGMIWRGVAWRGVAWCCVVLYCIALNPTAAAVTRLWMRVHFVCRWCSVIIPREPGLERWRIGHHLSHNTALEIGTVMTLNEILDEWFSDISRRTTFSSEILHKILTPKQTKMVLLWFQ